MQQDHAARQTAPAGEEARERYEAYCAARHNAFWQWLHTRMEERCAYLRQRVLQAADWTEYSRICGQLEALQGILAEVAAVCAPFEERREADDL